MRDDRVLKGWGKRRVLDSLWGSISAHYAKRIDSHSTIRQAIVRRRRCKEKLIGRPQKMIKEE